MNIKNEIYEKMKRLMKKSLFCFLLLFLVPVACSEKWEAPEGFYLDLTEINAFNVVDKEYHPGHIMSICTLKPEAKKRLDEYTQLLIENSSTDKSLSICYKGKPLLLASMWLGKYSWFPEGISVTDSYPDKPEWDFVTLVSNGDHSAYNQLLELLKEKKIPVKHVEHLPE